MSDRTVTDIIRARDNSRSGSVTVCRVTPGMTPGGASHTGPIPRPGVHPVTARGGTDITGATTASSEADWIFYTRPTSQSPEETMCNCGVGVDLEGLDHAGGKLEDMEQRRKEGRRKREEEEGGRERNIRAESRE
eukprot:759057-Hanusia_phi.AAC.7